MSSAQCNRHHGKLGEDLTGLSSIAQNEYRIHKFSAQICFTEYPKAN